MPTTVRHLTVEEYVALPERETESTELHHGEIVYMPPPKRQHSDIRDRIIRSLRDHAEKLGKFSAEHAFQVADDDVREADIGFTYAARYSGVRADGYLQGAPDLVIEILSPSNTIPEIRAREALCLAHGTIEFWTVSAEKRTIRVATKSAIQEFTSDDTITCSLFPGWSARVADLLA